MGFSEYSSTQKVNAEQIEDEPRSVITPSGPITAQPGQWEVRYPDGNVQVVDDEQFQVAFGSGADSEETESESESGPTESSPAETEPSTQAAATTPYSAETESASTQTESVPAGDTGTTAQEPPTTTAGSPSP